MFKKLKDKLAEEISPQRIQQLTQSVTERLQNSVDNNVFSIAEDDTPNGDNDNDSNFTSVSLQNTKRRNSNTSIASDVSFLPRYETNFNPYHLQSDLDISASEIEDNASSSSQLGHVSKEQVHLAFQKAQMRYHKYRGRYTDLANHYKELEKENSKMRALLVEQQDKAIRRMSELREQCSLSQKAKADLEQALRTEIEEKQIIISTLKDKIDLLQNQTSSGSELNDLKAKIEDLKASAIISQSRDSEYKDKISLLEKNLADKQSHIVLIEERERGNNLKFASVKKDLHAELESKETEINNLRVELEANKKVNDKNLMLQNTKLIEKNEALVKKCRDYEAELVKMEQYCLEIKELKMERAELKRKCDSLEINEHECKEKVQILVDENNYVKNKLLDLEGENTRLIGEIEGLNCNAKEMKESLDNLEVLLKDANESKRILCEKFEADRLKLQDDSREKLLELEDKVRHVFEEEFRIKEGKLTAEFESKIQALQNDDSMTQTMQSKIEEDRGEIEKLNKLVEKLEEELKKGLDDFIKLEIKHLLAMDSIKEHEEEISRLKRALEVSQNELSLGHDELVISKTSIEKLKREKLKLKEDYLSLESKIFDLDVIITDLKTNIQGKSEELELTKQKLLESNDLVKSLEKNVEVKNKDLKTFLEASQDLNDLKEINRNLKQEIDSITSNMEVLSKKCTDYEQVIKEFNLEIKPNFENQISDLNQQLTSMHDIQNNYKLTLEENNKLKSSIMELESIKPNLQSQIDKLNLEIDELKDKNKIILDENKILKDTNAKLENFNKTAQLNLETQLNQQIEEIQDLKNKHKLTLEENQVFKTNITPNYESTISDLKKQLEQFKNLQVKHKEALQENNDLAETIGKLESQINDLKQQFEEVQDVKSKYKLALDENDNLKEEILQLEELHAKIESLNSENEVKVKKIAEANAEKQQLHVELKALEMYKNQNLLLTEEINQMRISLDNISLQNEALALKHETLKTLEKKYENSLHEKQAITEKLAQLENEITELSSRNTQVSSDNRQLVKENESLIVDCAEYKMKYENFNLLKIQFEETINHLNEKNNKLTNDYESLSSDHKSLGEQLKKLQSCQMPLNDSTTDLQTKLIELTGKYEKVLEDNKNFKSELAKCSSELQNLIVEKKKVETLLHDMEHNCTELSHERQLLKDEIVELKTAPINVHNDLDKKAREIENLREKLEHYKSIDLTNRSSIEFYEAELQKMKNKNEKINRKLDETLVTLNHCADLSESTEIEYLKNVLYNYMLGKESLVMARVLAAVCKFDSQQTEAVLKHEQHKQSLLGQLGIL